MIPRIAFVFAIIAFIAGLAVATFSELRVFLPALLRGAVVTVEIGALSILLFLFMRFDKSARRPGPFAVS